MSDDKPKILTGKELAAEVESLRKLCGYMKPVSMEEVREILSKCGSLSGEIIKQRRGGDMWEDLKKWLESFDIQFPLVKEKMKEIEKEYGIE